MSGGRRMRVRRLKMNPSKWVRVGALEGQKGSVEWRHRRRWASRAGRSSLRNNIGKESTAALGMLLLLLLR